MKAAVLGDSGVEVRDLPKPEPKPNEILIRVRASSLNRADLLVASGHQHGSVGGVGARIGLECSGEVEAVGSEVKDIKAGDRVMASAPGGFAEYVVDRCRAGAPHPRQQYELRTGGLFSCRVADHAQCGRNRRPAQAWRDHADAGRQRRRRPDGHADRQDSRRVAGARNVDKCGTPGAACRIWLRCRDRHDESSWPDRVKAATDGKGVNLIVDLVSGGVANGNLAAAALLGRIVNVGRLGGMKGEFDFDLHALKRVDYIGVTFRTRSTEEVREINRLMRADLWPAIEAGKLSLPIYKAYKLAAIAEALSLMRANQHFGKIVIAVS